MIKIITDEKEIDKSLLNSHLSGKKFLAYLKAYGLNYDFCRFYKLEYENASAYMFMINSTLTLCSNDNFDVEELANFIEMNLPFRVEESSFILEQIPLSENYRRLNRTIFEIVYDDKVEKIDDADVISDVKLDDVYHILYESFANLSDYELWYTDSSHRIRHNTSKIYTYLNSSTVSAVFDIDGEVLIGQVATKINSRGKGYARKLLNWIAHQMEKQNKKAYLLALDTRVSYYKELGFKEIERGIVLERSDGNPQL